MGCVRCSIGSAPNCLPLSNATNPLRLESKTVRVVPYDDRWPAPFEAEARRIVEAVKACGLPPLALEHVGSTAVPGLAAKSILDVAAGRSATIDPLPYVPVLESVGYRQNSR